MRPHLKCNQRNKSLLPKHLQRTEYIIFFKLSVVDKASSITKFFVENKCSVCLSNHKEILDENLYSVVPSCGYPLCFKCDDGILTSKRMKRPRCIVNADSFKLMKFNAELLMKTLEQKVFL